jgi:hypothetical protein
MTLTNRIRKLETSLPPKEAALLWLAEAQECSSYVDYLRTVAADPIVSAPRVKLPNVVAKAVRDSLPQQLQKLAVGRSSRNTSPPKPVDRSV